MCAEPTIAELHPDLVERLSNPADAAVAASRWVEWRCPAGVETHRTWGAPAEHVASEKIYCGQCRAKAKFYSQHRPGDVIPARSSKAAAKIEEGAAAALAELMPTVGVRRLASIVLPPTSGYFSMYSITPDVILESLKVAIEIDGGDGSGRSRHDSPEGVADDETRDRLLSELGWRVLRVRHPNAAPICSSATVVRTKTSSSRVMAALVFDAVQTMGSASPTDDQAASYSTASSIKPYGGLAGSPE